MRSGLRRYRRLSLKVLSGNGFPGCRKNLRALIGRYRQSADQREAVMRFPGFADQYARARARGDRG